MSGKQTQHPDGPVAPDEADNPFAAVGQLLAAQQPAQPVAQTLVMTISINDLTGDGSVVTNVGQLSPERVIDHAALMISALTDAVGNMTDLMHRQAKLSQRIADGALGALRSSMKEGDDELPIHPLAEAINESAQELIDGTDQGPKEVDA